MKQVFWKRCPWAASVLSALLCVFMVSAGSAAAQIFALNAANTYWLTAGACVLSSLAGLLLMKSSGQPLCWFGFKWVTAGSRRKVLYFLPLLLLEVLPFLFFRVNSSAPWGIVLIFVLAVGLNEELFFRGLVFRFLQQKSTKTAVVGSAVLFGLLHSANLLGGADPLYTLLQVAFSFLVGFVLAQLVFLTGSLWPLIIWHGVHNFISIQTGDEMNSKALILLVLQTIILLVYALVLRKKMTDDK